MLREYREYTDCLIERIKKLKGEGMETCENCKYWRADGECMEYIGKCLKRAPILDCENSRWPQTGRKEWCGEWEIDPEAPPDEDEVIEDLMGEKR